MKLLKQLSIVFLVVAVVAFAVNILSRTVKQKNEHPVISMESENIQMSVVDPEEMILSGVSAQDHEDGDVSSSLVIESISMGASEKERTVTIAAFDNDNNVTKATRTVTYTDYTVPRFSLNGTLSVPTGTSMASIAQKLSAQDPIDGNISSRIQYYNANGSQFNPNVPGVYSIVFSVSNEVGLVEEFTASVEVYDKTEKLPVSIELTDNIVYVEKGGTFDPQEYISAVTAGNETYTYKNGALVNETTNTTFDDIEIDNSVNTSVPGWYEIDYTAIYDDQPARTAYLLVRVQE